MVVGKRRNILEKSEVISVRLHIGTKGERLASAC